MSVGARNRDIDVLRGILVLCVVLGHAIQQYGVNLGAGWQGVESLVYSFHMPAFVFVAGFCSYRIVSLSSLEEKWGYVRSRSLRLLVPYFVWGAIYFALRACLANYARLPYDYDRVGFFLLGYNPDGAMWFVWALFTAMVMLLPLSRRLTKPWVAGVLFAISAVQFWLWPDCEPFARAVFTVPKYMFFVALGVWSRHIVSELSEWARKMFFGPVCLLAFVAAYWLIGTKCPGASAAHLLTSVFAVFFLYGASKRIVSEDGLVCRWIETLGVEAMTLYVLSEPVKVGCRILLAKFGMPLALSFPIMLILMLAIPLVLLKTVLRRNRLSRGLLLGEWR